MASKQPQRRRADTHQANKILLDYDVGRTVGEGGFAKVKLAHHKHTGEPIAIKIVDKTSLSKVDVDRLTREVAALRTLKHQNICQLYEVYDCGDKLYMLMEYAPGGELFDYIVQKQRLKEHEARRFLRQIASSVAFCHKNNFVHRDLKPENLLLDAQNNVKLIDFGLVSNPVEGHHVMLQTCCGSPAYAAPELIAGEEYVGVKADMWSLGVLLYALLCGFLPFDHDNITVLYELITSAKYELPDWVSPESAELIAELLRPIPEQRPSIEQLLAHPWMQKGYENCSPLTGESTLATNLEQDVLLEMSSYIQKPVNAITEYLQTNCFGPVSTLYSLLNLKKKRGEWPPIYPGQRNKLDATTVKSPTAIPAKSSATPNKGAGSSAIDMVDMPSSSPCLYTQSSVGSQPATQQLQFERGSLNSERVAGNSNKPVRSHSTDAGEYLRHGTDLPLDLDEFEASPENRVSTMRGNSPVKGNNVNDKYDYLAQNGSGASIFASHSDDLFNEGVDAMSLGDDDTSNRSRRSRNGNSAIVSTASGSVPPSPAKLAFDQLTFSIKNALTGGTRQNASNVNGPTSTTPGSPKKDSATYVPHTVSGMFNVETTSNMPAKDVLHEIVRVLIDNEIHFAQKEPFLITCRKQEPGSTKFSIVWEMEICHIDKLNLRGIRLKRLKGEFMKYKSLCSTILGQANL
eukprot:CFRG2973T1